MIFNNLSNKVLLLFSEQGYENASYIVEELLFNGCTTNSIITSGTTNGDAISLTIPDGYYKITVTSETNPTLEENFSVFYNELPNLISTIKSIICPCKSCNEKEDELTLPSKLLYLQGLLQKWGKFCSSYLFRNTIDAVYREVENAREYRAYYGSHNINNNKLVEKVFVYTYIELYYETVNVITDGEELNSLNSIFEIDYIERCLLEKGYNIQDILCTLEKLNCNCNE